MNDDEIGSIVRAWRTSHGHSQKDLADALDVHYTYVSHVEKGRKRLNHELARRLDSHFGTAGELADAVAGMCLATDDRSASSPHLRPFQVPAADELVDRQQLVHTITSRLSSPHKKPLSGPQTVVLTGAGGIGKTALAVALAHRLHQDYEGVLWADLCGWDENTGPRCPELVLRSWCASALGTPLTQLPSDLDELLPVWRSGLAHRRWVIGVDNARSDQIPVLIPPSPGSVVLVTTRVRAANIPGQPVWVSVPPLEHDDAVTLITARSGQSRERVLRLAERGAGMPLALRSLADYIAAHTKAETAADEELISDMSTETTPPDAVRRAARLSYQQLSADQARAWRLCAILPQVSPAAAAAATGLEEREVRALLNGVADATLLSKRGRNWEYHELHRTYALEESQRVDPRAERDAAYQRALLFMLHGWAHAGVMLAPDREIGPPLDAPPPRINLPQFESFDAALKWSETTWEYLHAAVERAVDRGWIRLAWQLVAASFNYAILAKPWEKAYELVNAVVECTERADVVEGLAWMRYMQGYIDTERGHLDDAVTHLGHSLRLRRKRGDDRDIGWAAQCLARAHLLRGDPPDDALALLDEALGALDNIGANSASASARSLRGTVNLAQGSLDDAAADLSRAVDQLPVNGDPLLHCYAHTRLASVRLQQQLLDQAEELARHAIAYAREHSARPSEIDGLDVLGHILSERGDIEGARGAWQRGIEIADNVGGPEADRLQDQLDTLAE